MSRRDQPMGLRREVLVFVPTALLLLIVIAGFNLYVHRESVLELERSRAAEVERLAEGIAARLVQERGRPDGDTLARLAPPGAAIAIFDDSGLAVAQSATPVWTNPMTIYRDDPPSEAVSLVPSEHGAPLISALAPLSMRGRSYLLQVDLPADMLAAQFRGLQRTLLVNIIALASLTLLVLLFMRRMLAPYESMLEVAQGLETDPAPGTDEVEFLLGTFQRAVHALESREGDPDDIAALERALGPNIESGLLLLDHAGTAIALNQVGARLLGVELEAPGVPLADLLERQPAMADALAAGVQGQATVNRQEVELLGEPPRLIGLTLNPLRRDDQSVRGYIVLFADLTEPRARAREAQVANSLKQLGGMAVGIAHELRNGLATLKGYLTLIEHRPDDNSVADYLGEMKAEAQHLERVIKDFLSFARPESIELAPIDVAAMVHQAARDPSLAGSPVEVECGERLAPVSGDSQLLERVIRNLLHNAAQSQAAHDIETPIDLRVVETGDEIVLTIDDRGPGLAPDIEHSIFQPFVSGRANGVGMGLTLARQITELHAGSLKVENRPSGGARATLRLPTVTFDTNRNKSIPAGALDT